MKMSELIAAYGDDKVEVQYLDLCALTLDMNTKGTTITFGTEQPLDLKGTKKVGIIVWLDRERVKRIIAQEKSGATHDR